MAKDDPVALTVDSLRTAVSTSESETADLRAKLKEKVAEAQALRAQIAQAEGDEVQQARDILQQLDRREQQQARRARSERE